MNDVPLGIPPELESSSTYADVRELNKGGMGVVYLAKNRLMDRLEVLKVINGALVTDPNLRKRFLREIQAAAQLLHPNIVVAYSAIELGQTIVMAMEYVPGENLTDLVKKNGPLSVRRACTFAAQIATGLQHAFERGLVHRDIKPSNVICTTQNKKTFVKIVDFGLAKLNRENSPDNNLTATGATLGTPLFMAPEQARDATTADIRADIYSLGATLYYLLAGRPPITGKNYNDIVVRLITEEPDVPIQSLRPEVTAELAAVIERMLKKDPNGRFQTPLEVAQALLPFAKQKTPGEAFGLPVYPNTHNDIDVSLPVIMPAAPHAEPLAATRDGRRSTHLGAKSSTTRTKGESTTARRANPVEDSPDTPRPQVTNVANTSGRSSQRNDGPRAVRAWLRTRWVATAFAIAGVAGYAGHLLSRQPKSESDATPSPKELSRAKPPSVAPVENGDGGGKGKDTPPPNAPPPTVEPINPFKVEARPGEPSPNLAPVKKVDAQLEKDWEDYDRTVKTRGKSLPYFEDRGPSRVASWKVLAEGGDPKAMVLFGRCLQTGAGVLTKNGPEAVKWYRKAAGLDLPRAITCIGACYLDGAGVSKDTAAAVAWCRKAADLDDPVALCILGDCYADGSGVSKDAAQAVVWYRKAADLGNCVGMVRLGYSYRTGTGISLDATQAVVWYRKAADLGNSVGMAGLGVCYKDGAGVGQDGLEAVSWYRKAADLGDPEGMTGLGTCHRDGAGVSKDAVQAVAWFRKAADLGEPVAMTNLGYCYLNGTGLAKDADEGVKWYRKAAELHEPYGMYNLGSCYESGIGVPVRDPFAAVNWYREAAAKGNVMAMRSLARCYTTASGVAYDLTLASYWTNEANKAEKLQKP